MLLGKARDLPHSVMPRDIYPITGMRVSECCLRHCVALSFQRHQSQHRSPLTSPNAGPTKIMIIVRRSGFDLRIVRCTDGGPRSVREAQVLDSDSDSDDSGPVYGGRSDDEGVLRCICCMVRNVIFENYYQDLFPR